MSHTKLCKNPGLGIPYPTPNLVNYHITLNYNANNIYDITQVTTLNILYHSWRINNTEYLL